MKLSWPAAAKVAALLLSSGVSAFIRQGGMLVGPIDDTMLEGKSGFNGWGTFDQPIDHANKSLGTFKQRYWYGTEYWKGPGSPVILITPGEQPADNFNVTYTSQQRLTGRMAQKVGGAVIVLEHRYWGDSSPFEVLSDDNMVYLTLDNSLKDLTYFANNFDAPFDDSGKSTPKHAPWFFSGGSYSGALAGWLAALEPGTFWGYHGTSGVVESLADFWQYFVPVEEATPQNCTKDLTNVIEYIDDILLHGTEKQKHNLKAKFLLEDLEDVDFVGAIENAPWTWQGTQFYTQNITGYVPYYQFCDYLENVGPNSTNTIPGPEGVGTCDALKGYAKWFTEVFLPDTCQETYGYDDFQGTLNVNCFKAMNSTSPIYTDLTPRNTGNRQWFWMLCNEPFEWWQNGAPKDRPTIVSRLVNNAYGHAQCERFFPSKNYAIATQGARAEDVNRRTGGWDVTNTTRLMYANGEWDPWRDVTVSSIFRPGGPLASTPELPVRVIPHGTHCSDLYGNNWGANAGVLKIVDEEVAQVERWAEEFYAQKG